MDRLRMFFAIFLHAIVADGLSKTNFTLYTSPRANWQAAVAFCRQRGQELIRVTSQAEDDFLKSLGMPGGLWYNKNNGHMWSSLHDPDGSTPGQGYQWQLLEPRDCQRLTPETWRDWFSGEPLNINTNLCVKLEWTNREGFEWRTENCNTELQKIACQSEGGTCDYETQSSRTILNTSAIARVTRFGIESPSQCWQECISLTDPRGTCSAAKWTGNISQDCVLYLADRLFTVADTVFEPTKTFLLLPKCFAASLNENTFTELQKAFESQCNEATVPTTNSVPQTPPPPPTTAPMTGSEQFATTLTSTPLPITKTETAQSKTTPTSASLPMTTTETAQSTTTLTSAALPTTTTETAQSATTLTSTSLPKTEQSTTTLTSTSLRKTTTEAAQSTTTLTSTSLPKTEQSTTTLTSTSLRKTSTETVQSTTTLTSTSLPKTEQSTTTLTSTSLPKTEQSTTTLTSTSLPKTTRTGPSTTTLAAASTKPTITSADVSKTTENFSTRTTTAGNVTSSGQMWVTVCACTGCDVNTSSSNTTDQYRVLSDLVKALVIDEKQTSMYKRKYISVPDQRTSAQTIGWLGAMVLLLVLGLIVAMDVSTVCCKRAHIVSQTEDEEAALKTMTTE